MKRKLIYFSIICTLLVACGSNDKPKDPMEWQKHWKLKFQDYNFENPPQFRKDGDLRFYDSNTQEELFHIKQK